MHSKGIYIYIYLYIFIYIYIYLYMRATFSPQQDPPFLQDPERLQINLYTTGRIEFDERAIGLC